MSADIVGILLAAGRSKRFGSNKLLHELRDNTPLVLASAQILSCVCQQTIAVVNDPNDETAQCLTQANINITTNPCAHLGIGTSIASGVKASQTAAGWIIALADMPYIPKTIIQQIMKRLSQGSKIVAPLYQQQRGHPVGFSAHYAGALMKLTGDEGARNLIKDSAGEVDLIATSEPGVIIDIDTPAMLLND